MKRHAIAALLAATLALPVQAATRGGTLVFGRAIESQYPRPGPHAQNADIWLALNLYDTLVLATRGRQDGPSPAWRTAPRCPTTAGRSRSRCGPA